MSHSSKGIGAGHLAVDSPTVKANTAVSFLSGWPNEFLDVVHFGAAGESMHDEEHWRLGTLFGVHPIQRYMPTVREVYPLAFKLKGE